MVEYLDGNRHYPIATDERDVVPLLRNPQTRAVIGRFETWRDDLAKIRRGLSIQADFETARKFESHSVYDDRETYPGLEQDRTLGHFSLSEIMKHAQAAGIKVDPDAINLLHEKTKEARALYQRVYQDYTGNKEKKHFSYLFFAPKKVEGAEPVGRAINPHVDNVELAGHLTLAFAGLSMFGGSFPREYQDFLDKGKDDHIADEPESAEVMLDWYYNARDGFIHSVPGDFVFTKGQLGKDLSNPDHQEEVCVHNSSPRIPWQGQATLFFHPERDIDLDDWNEEEWEFLTSDFKDNTLDI